MGSRCRGGVERQGAGARPGTGRFVPAGSGGDAPEYAHSLHPAVEGTHRAGSRLRTIPRRSVVGRPGKIKTIEGLGCCCLSAVAPASRFEPLSPIVRRPPPPPAISASRRLLPFPTAPWEGRNPPIAAGRCDPRTRAFVTACKSQAD